MKGSTIGIIGGMGPHAGIYLADRITAHTLAAGDADHVSLILASRPGEIPDRTTYLFDNTAPDPSPVILETAEDLIAQGCRVLGIPCNTAHAPPILDPVISALRARHPDVTCFHLIQETASYCRVAAPEAQRIGLLATVGTYGDGMYERALEAEGLTPVIPSDAVKHDVVHRALYDAACGIKSQSSPVTAQATQLLEDACVHLKEHGAEAVILGCTELPLAIKDRTFAGLPVVDSTTALARALIHAVAPQKLAPLA